MSRNSCATRTTHARCSWVRRTRSGRPPIGGWVFDIDGDSPVRAPCVQLGSAAVVRGGTSRSTIRAIPYQRGADALRSPFTSRVELDGIVLADTRSPVLLFETGIPTRYYIDPGRHRFRASGPPRRERCVRTKGDDVGLCGDAVHHDLAGRITIHCRVAPAWWRFTTSPSTGRRCPTAASVQLVLGLFAGCDRQRMVNLIPWAGVRGAASCRRSRELILAVLNLGGLSLLLPAQHIGAGHIASTWTASRAGSSTAPEKRRPPANTSPIDGRIAATHDRLKHPVQSMSPRRRRRPTMARHSRIPQLCGPLAGCYRPQRSPPPL